MPFFLYCGRKMHLDIVEGVNLEKHKDDKCKKKKKSHVQFSSWVRRGCWADTLDLRSDCSFWHHANFKTQFLKPGTILLLGVIQAAAIRHGEGAWLPIPDLFIVCCLPPCCRADGICMRYWLQKQICLQLRQSFASCQYVYCTHGENWAKLWEGSDSVHVLLSMCYIWFTINMSFN